MAIDLTAFLEKSLRETAALWTKDLAAHRDEEFTSSPCETVRSVAGIAYETIFVNRRILSRLKGESVSPMDGFPACPVELQSRDALAATLSESVEEVIAAIGDPEREIVRPDGSILTAFELADFAVMHMQYHLGQVNYVQTLYGDAQIHWM